MPKALSLADLKDISPVHSLCLLIKEFVPPHYTKLTQITSTPANSYAFFSPGFDITSREVNGSQCNFVRGDHSNICLLKRGPVTPDNRAN